MMVKQSKKMASNQILLLNSKSTLKELSQFLLGYILGNSGMSIFCKQIFKLKQKFDEVTKFVENMIINRHNFVEVTVESLFIVKSLYGDDVITTYKTPEVINEFINYLTIYVNETAFNSKFIMNKWISDEKNQALNSQLIKMIETQEKKRKKEQQQKTNTMECPICICTIELRDISPSLSCQHLFHLQCLRMHLKMAIENSETNIKCPLQQCGLSLQPSQIYSAIDDKLKQKFSNFSFNKYVQKNATDTSWCPTAGCLAVFSFDNALDNYKCPQCAKHYCLKCRCQYHEKMTCAEYRINNHFSQNDKKFQGFVKGAKYKQCPRCKFWVQKNKGCCTISCRCGHEFCYECGGTECPHGSCNNSGRKK